MKRYQTDKKIEVPRFEEAQGFYTTEQRSKMMSKIRGKNTKPEKIFRKALWAEGLRYRISGSGLIGKPDVVIKKYRLVIFIDGEFWHGYKWEEKKKKIKSNKAFWIPKIERNMQRDLEVNKKLGEIGYCVFRFWDFQIKNDLEECIEIITKYIKGEKMALLNR
jgi:DNA mismatch endonuclease (patch repair protein)